MADNAAGSGLNANSTTFTLQRGSDNNYWTGSAWQLAAANLAATNTATTRGRSGHRFVVDGRDHKHQHPAVHGQRRGQLDHRPVQRRHPPAGTTGKPESGDTLTLTVSEAMDTNSILSGWNGFSTNVVVRITDGGSSANDVLTVWDATNTNQVALGSVNLGSKAFVTGNVSFSSSTMVHSSGVVTLTLGTVSDSTKVGTDAGNNKLTWTPSSSAQDVAGNAASTGTSVSSNTHQF